MRLRLGAFVALLLAAILLPFALWENAIATWADTLLDSRRGDLLVFLAAVALLTVDILLPIPSSLISAAAMVLLGPVAGTLAVWLGMTGGGALGYWLGRTGGARLAGALVGQEAMTRVASLGMNSGLAVIAVTRAVPVLAEAAILLAGAFGLAWLRVAATLALANFGVALAYATITALGANIGVLPAATIGALLVPALAMALVQISGRARRTIMSRVK